MVQGQDAEGGMLKGVMLKGKDAAEKMLQGQDAAGASSGFLYSFIGSSFKSH